MELKEADSIKDLEKTLIGRGYSFYVKDAVLGGYTKRWFIIVLYILRLCRLAVL
jgi:hypothetical protein